MRVALVSPPFESVPPRKYGGTERVIHDLCLGLSESGVDVTLFASGDSVVPDRVELVPVVDRSLRMREKPVRDASPYSLKVLSEVARRAGAFDLIHNHHDYWLMPLAAMNPRKAILTTMHGRLDFSDIDTIFEAHLGSKFVSISDSQRAPMPNLPWVRTIHHGIDAEKFRFYGKPGKYLAFLGRIHPEKRPDWAIYIAKRAGVPLKIAAKIEGRENQEYYDALVRPHVDGRNVEFVGEIGEAEKSDFLGNALALAFPIDWSEPFGLVMVESLACGTPVLARPCGAAAEVLCDRITGYSDMDLDVLARRVRDLPSIDRRGCREWVKKRFSLQRMTENYLDVYRQLVEFSFAGTRARRPKGSPRQRNRHRRDLVHPVERSAHRNS